MENRIDRLKEHIETVKRLRADADPETRRKLEKLLSDMENYLRELEAGGDRHAR
ncbi:MAG: hypothetical protein AB7H70_06880 [Rhodospirillaceae bacterium]